MKSILECLFVEKKKVEVRRLKSGFYKGMPVERFGVVSKFTLHSCQKSGKCSKMRCLFICFGRTRMREHE